MNEDVDRALEAIEKRCRDARRLRGPAHARAVKALNSELRTVANSLRASRPALPLDAERRFAELANFELHAIANELPTITGYASVFASLSCELPGGYREIVLPGAFKRSIERAEVDVKATIEHDPNKLLGRTGNGTLKLAEDRKGLRFCVQPPETNYARDLLESMKRGDIIGASFTFKSSSHNNRWTTDSNGRTIRQIINAQLLEISVVAQPAYDAASAIVRAFVQRGTPYTSRLHDA